MIAHKPARALLLVTSAALTTLVFGQSKSALQFYDSTGTTKTVKFGWTGGTTDGHFFISTPSDGEAVSLKGKDLTVMGGINATSLSGDGSNVTNVPLAQVTGLSSELILKADKNHPHSPADIIGKIKADSIENGGFLINSAGDSGKVWKSTGNGRGAWADDIGGAPHQHSFDDVTTGAVTTAQIADGAVTSAKIGDATITSSDLSSTLQTTINGKMDKAAGASNAFTGPVYFNSGNNKILFFGQCPANDSIARFCFYNTASTTKWSEISMATGPDGSEMLNLGHYGTKGAKIHNNTGNLDIVNNATADINLKEARDIYLYAKNDINLKPEAGAVRINGTVINTSDLRLKQGVTPLSSALDKILKLQGVSFQMKSEVEHSPNPKTHLGFIAQDIEKVIPEVVYTGTDGYKAVAYTELISMLTEAIKEQQTIISRQNEMIQKHEVKLVEQQKEIVAQRDLNSAQAKIVDNQQQVLRTLDKRLSVLEGISAR